MISTTENIYLIFNFFIRITEVNDFLLSIPNTSECLEHIKNLFTRHSEYAKAIENLNHVFTIQKSVARAMELIDADKLLQAHQCLIEMEVARDDILFELYNLPEQYTSDKITLKHNFAKLETVSSQLAQKIQMTLKRCLTTVRKEPTIIVTALRIVQREEKADEFAMQVSLFICVDLKNEESVRSLKIVQNQFFCHFFFV